MAKYIPSLNGLRAFAILLVLIAHMSKAPGFPNFFYTFLQDVNLGTVGVRLFFLLSGYLITHVLINEYKAKGSISIKNFFWRRILRIFPNFYFYLLMLSVLSSIGLISISFEAIFFALFYVQNYNLWQNTEAFATSWFVQHSWSLSVEEQFYLTYPFLFKYYRSFFEKNLLIISVLTVLSCTFFRAMNYSIPEVSRWLGSPFFMHADFIFLGCVMRFSIDRYKQKIKRIFYPFKELILFLAFGVVLLSSALEYKSGINIIIFGNLILLGNALIFSYFLFFPESKLGILFETKILRFCGKLSYSLYVWQQLFLGSTSLWIKYEYLTYFPTNIIMVFHCALFSYYFIEKPFLKLKTKIAI